MRRTLLYFLVLVLSVLWFKDFVASGRFVAHLDAHPNRRGTATCLFYMARMHEIMSNDAKSLPLYKRVADRYPKSRYGMDAQYGVAVAHEHLKQYAQAMEEYAKFLELYPKSPYAVSVRNNLEILKTR
jgi:TolA-binding protein